MSSKIRPSQYADPRGVVVESNLVSQGLLAVGAAAPTNSVVGYCHGCLYVNTGGGVGTTLYINTGTAASSTWTNIV